MTPVILRTKAEHMNNKYMSVLSLQTGTKIILQKWTHLFITIQSRLTASEKVSQVFGYVI